MCLTALRGDASSPPRALLFYLAPGLGLRKARSASPPAPSLWHPLALPSTPSAPAAGFPRPPLSRHHLSDWLPRLPPPLQLQGKSGSDELPSNLPPMSSTTLPPLPGTSPLLLPPHLGGSWLGPPMPPVPQQQGEGPTAAQQASELTPGGWV